MRGCKKNREKIKKRLDSFKYACYFYGMNAKLLFPAVVITGVMAVPAKADPVLALINSGQVSGMAPGSATIAGPATGAEAATAAANGAAAVGAMGGATSSLPGVPGSVSNFLGGMFGGGAAAGGAGAAGAGAAGVGAMVQDIANIILQGLQIWQLFSQTSILGQQQETLNDIKKTSAQDLATTQELLANLGSTANFNAAARTAFPMPSPSDNLLGLPATGLGPGGALPNNPGAGGGNGLSELLSSERSPLSRIGDFIGGKASSLYDIFSDASTIASMSGGFRDRPVETSMEIIKMLFADNRTQQLQDLTADQMANYGFGTTIGALSNELDVQLLKSSQNAGDRYQSRMARIGTIQQYLNDAQDQSSVLVLQAQLQKEIAGIQADNLAANEAANAAAAARAVNESAFVKMKVLENQSMMRMSR